MRTERYDETGRKLSALGERLEGLGVRNASDRMATYSKDIRELTSAVERDSVATVLEHRGIERLVASLFEGSILADLHEELEGQTLDEIAGRLRRIFRGPANAVDETPGKAADARNVMFELQIGCRFSRVGGAVTFPEPNPDVDVVHEGRRYLIQCKRPFYRHTIGKEIEAAAAQLVRDLDAAGDDNARGIAAVSVSRALNPDFGLFNATRPGAIAALGDKVQAVAAETQASWAALDNRITAILLHCATPMVIATHPRLVVAQQSVLVNRATKIKDANEREELKQLGDSLSEDDPV